MNTAQVVQLVGAIPILIAFVAAQLERLNTHSNLYLALNFVGSAILPAAPSSKRNGVFSCSSVYGAYFPCGPFQKPPRPRGRLCERGSSPRPNNAYSGCQAVDELGDDLDSIGGLFPAPAGQVRHRVAGGLEAEAPSPHRGFVVFDRIFASATGLASTPATP